MSVTVAQPAQLFTGEKPGFELEGSAGVTVHPLMTAEGGAKIDVFYDGVQVGEYFPDYLVEDRVIVELKAAEQIAPEHEAQLLNYLKASTTGNGGVVYSLNRNGAGAPVGGERPALTAAAIACLFSAGEYKDDLVKKWFKYCKKAIPIGQAGRIDGITPAALTLLVAHVRRAKGRPAA